jgi:hypothetical protein
MKTSLPAVALRFSFLAAALFAVGAAHAAEVDLHWLDGALAAVALWRKLGRAVAARHCAKRPSVFAGYCGWQRPAVAILDAGLLAGWLHQIHRLCHYGRARYEWQSQAFNHCISGKRHYSIHCH